MDYIFNYNYVVFSWLMPNCKNIDDDYYAICLRDLADRDDVVVNYYPLQDRSFFLRLLYRISNSRIFNNKFWTFKRSIWYPFIFKNKFKNKKPVCFVCIRFPEPEYLLYLRKHNPNSKIVMFCRDLLKTHMSDYLKYQHLKESVYDYWVSYDEDDCAKYGFVHLDEFESKLNIYKDDEYPLCDVFFTGRAKDRLPRLLEIYDVLTSKGVKCLFLIMGAPKDIMKGRDGFKCIDAPIPYSEMLRLTVNSRCLLDLNQSECVGYTSRILEAIIYNKKLITDNASILKTKYYSPLHIQYVKSPDEIDVRIIKDNPDVDFHYVDEFSPLRRLAQIDKLLVQ